MNDTTPRAKCSECGSENIVCNSHAQTIWERCETCDRYATQTMTNIVRQKPTDPVVELVTEDAPEAAKIEDACGCGHTRLEHSHVTGLCMECDCEGFQE